MVRNENARDKKYFVSIYTFYTFFFFFFRNETKNKKEKERERYNSFLLFFFFRIYLHLLFHLFFLFHLPRLFVRQFVSFIYQWFFSFKIPRKIFLPYFLFLLFVFFFILRTSTGTLKRQKLKKTPYRQTMIDHCRCHYCHYIYSYYCHDWIKPTNGERSLNSQWKCRDHVLRTVHTANVSGRLFKSPHISSVTKIFPIISNHSK